MSKDHIGYLPTTEANPDNKVLSTTTIHDSSSINIKLDGTNYHI